MIEAVRDGLAEGERAGLRYALGLPRRSPVGIAGGVPGRRAGSSLEFRDFREYQPGDDVRHVDWNAYARTDQLSVKLYREELHPHVDVVLDASRSMDLEGSVKAQAAAALAAFFATAAANAGYAHAVWLLGARPRPVPHGNAPPARWEGIAFDHCGSPLPTAEAAGLWRARGLRVLVSDLLWVEEPLMFLRPFTERAAGAVVVQVLAAADVEPPAEGNLRLVDAETGREREVRVDAAAVRQYREALSRHREAWHRACRQAGAVFAGVIAEELLRDWRLDELVAAEVLKVV